MVTTSVSLHGVVLLLTINHALSNQYSGILSNLYAKAAQEKRPLILVLDNSVNSNPLTARLQDYRTKRPSYSVKKQTPSLSTYTGPSLPFLLLQQLQKPQSKQSSKPKISLLSEKYRSKTTKRPSFQLDRLDRDRSDEYHSLRILIKKPKPGIRSRPNIDGRLLRASILNNVLRQYNGKCGVIDDDCDVKKDSCEVQVECEEPKDSDECTFSDTCAEDDTQISTKGVLIDERFF